VKSMNMNEYPMILSARHGDVETFNRLVKENPEIRGTEFIMRLMCEAMIHNQLQIMEIIADMNARTPFPFDIRLSNGYISGDWILSRRFKTNRNLSDDMIYFILQRFPELSPYVHNLLDISIQLGSTRCIKFILQKRLQYLNKRQILEIAYLISAPSILSDLLKCDDDGRYNVFLTEHVRFQLYNWEIYGYQCPMIINILLALAEHGHIFSIANHRDSEAFGNLFILWVLHCDYPLSVQGMRTVYVVRIYISQLEMVYKSQPEDIMAFFRFFRHYFGNESRNPLSLKHLCRLKNIETFKADLNDLRKLLSKVLYQKFTLVTPFSALE
jgi:hypothetical protein